MHTPSKPPILGLISD